LKLVYHVTSVIIVAYFGETTWRSIFIIYIPDSSRYHTNILYSYAIYYDHTEYT